MFRRLIHELRLVDDVDPIAAFKGLPDLPEAPRMGAHITQPGDPSRHRKITPRLLLESIRYRVHLLKGGDDAEP